MLHTRMPRPSHNLGRRASRWQRLTTRVRFQATERSAAHSKQSHLLSVVAQSHVTPCVRLPVRQQRATRIGLLTGGRTLTTAGGCVCQVASVGPAVAMVAITKCTAPEHAIACMVLALSTLAVSNSGFHAYVQVP